MVEEWHDPRCQMQTAGHDASRPRSWSTTLKSGPSGSTSHEAILFWLINLSGMAVRTLATRPSHEFAISTKKRPDSLYAPKSRLARLPC